MLQSYNRKNIRGLRFFIPERLVKLEYLIDDDKNEKYDDEASEYQHLRELAFFVVNFGYTKRDFEELTLTERLFIMKAWENKKVLDTSLTAKAFFNAYTNANRKKNSKPTPLWKKKKEHKYNVIRLKKQFEDIAEHENNSSKDWVRLLYEGRS